MKIDHKWMELIKILISKDSEDYMFFSLIV